ncbi:protein adenylyltransferase SelO [Ramlibacter albus]|uniref:Protein nucleotidyltransferase YdiU n=1 Tax=Ramlibacter albus TaxID=2079448 RepID=A0A923M7Z3_9BURK|nr:YdiU family protein [Ramlibacter albus]MBC5764563.1 YdiU family protein [Ramlibacter albus]
MQARFDNSYARDLPGLYVPWKPAEVPAPRLLYLNRPLAEELGLDLATLPPGEVAAVIAGNRVPEGAEPIAQVYAGHQFGGFSPQLGDGRAVLLGEVVDRNGQRRDIALKGSGRTPFSRGGDGKAAVGPMLREVIIGEAMHALGIPTTRALAVAATGEDVYRERVLPGAVLARVAASHLRVGTFEFFASRDDREKLRQLADYAIARHDPDLAGTPGRYLQLLARVTQRQAELIAQWMNVGFIHGVMNTDNMTISGETIDYGPCAFMEAYDPRAVFSSIDHGGRYAYGNQPAIAQWNLARFAEALLPLVVGDNEDSAPAVAEATAVLETFPKLFQAALLRGLRAKLGFAESGDDAADAGLANDWLGLLHAQKVDFTLGWRRLADAAAGNDAPLQSLFADAEPLNAWLTRWRARCAQDATHSTETRVQQMRRASPWVIPRNHRVEEALQAASETDDLGPFERLLAALRNPYEVTAENAAYAQPAPEAVTACYQTFCGT